MFKFRCANLLLSVPVGVIRFMLTLALTSEGELFWEGEATTADERKLLALRQVAPVLHLLANQLLTSELSPALRWLREWGRLFLTRLCQTKALERTLLPSEAARVEFLASMPPFVGAEHVSLELLAQWWSELAAHIGSLSAGVTLEDWLRVECPSWHVVGRVTFHLAENKADAARPFAFLATFTEKLSESGQPQHLPLSRAVQQYAGRKDQAALEALLEPVRLAEGGSKLLREWLETKRLFQAMAMVPHEAYRLLKDTPVFQECGIVVKLPDWWRAGKGARPVVQVTVDAPQTTALHAGALLSFKVAASLDGQPLSEAELEKLFNAETGLVSLRGRWVEVDPARLQQVMGHWEKVQHAAGEGALGFLDGMRLLAGYGQPKGVAEPEVIEAVQEWSAVIAGKNLDSLLQQLQKPQPVEPPPDLRATLRPYQQQGFSWLVSRVWLGMGACLADDMGLGKTLQVIALLLHLQQTSRRPALLVVPASLVGNWKAEVAKFAPSLRLMIAHPSQATREVLEEVMISPAEPLQGYDVMLTTYQLLQRVESWQQHPWSLVILDEAQAIKNAGSGAARAVKALQAPARIALTGTPVENRPGDLWSLFDFLNPGLLGSQADFAAAVKRCVQSSKGYGPLRQLVSPYILRRMKTDRSIIQDLPEKIELQVFCGLTRRQATIYAKLVDQLAKMLNDPSADPIKRQGLVLGFLLKFKQVCNHPSQWNGDEAWQPADSGKFARLAEICGGLAERRERVLIFTQFQETCAPLARFLASIFGREGLILHGGTPVKKRPEIVQAFQQSGGPPFMVISVKAGGTGLNLTTASQVIHFDRWWNPAVENQATDRAFRIGQKRNVIVHKFVCQGTIEERIHAMIERKQALASDLVGVDSSAEKMLAQMNAQELLELVKLDVNAVL